MNDSQNGMLFVATDVATQDDADFNRWYDREHVEERVRVPGFYPAHAIGHCRGRQYLGLYKTESLASFTSAAYRAAFQHQTPWSVASLEKMRDPIRRVCAVEAVTGKGAAAISVSSCCRRRYRKRCMPAFCNWARSWLNSTDSCAAAY